MLFLISASSVRCFAAALASFMFLIESAASWFVITWISVHANYITLEKKMNDTQHPHCQNIARPQGF